MSGLLSSISSVASPWAYVVIGLLAAGWLGVAALAPLIKLIVHRPPPPAALAVIGDGDSSFPSTHDASTAAVLGLLAWLLVQRSVSWTRSVTIGVLGLLAVGFTGLSRGYLGLHWASDVAGSWSLGAAWLLIVAAAWTTYRRAGNRSAERAQSSTSVPEGSNVAR